jgi:hypothetical protein
MTEYEIKNKLHALSIPAKRWLHAACNQIADGNEYIDRPAERKECIAAGLVGMRGRYMEVDTQVVGLVYSGNCLADDVSLPNAGSEPPRSNT